MGGAMKQPDKQPGAPANAVGVGIDGEVGESGGGGPRSFYGVNTRASNARRAR